MPIAQPSILAWVFLPVLFGRLGGLPAQGPEDTLCVQRLSAPIIFDGVPDEPA